MTLNSHSKTKSKTTCDSNSDNNCKMADNTQEEIEANSEHFTQTQACLPEEVAYQSRRQLLRTGLSMVATVSLASLLNTSEALAQATFTPRRKLVWINMSGGWDLLETTDPKVSSTARIDMTYDWNLAHTLAGGDSLTRVGRWLPGIAANGQDVIIVRGLAMGTTSHDAGATYMDTAILSNNGTVNAASIPSIVASESAATIPIIQLAGGMQPRTDRGLLKNISVVRAENLDLYRSMYPGDAALIQRRLKILDYLKSSVTRMRDAVGTNDRLGQLETAESKIRAQIEGGMGTKLVLDATDRRPFQTTTATGTGGRARGQGNMGRAGEAFALALKLIKNDLVTCINMGVGGFDTHTNQDRNLQPVLTEFDASLKVFVDELRAAGKLDTTLIVLYSDFGRTPKVNMSNGRDHWPIGGSIIIGGGLVGGRAVGGTDDSMLALNADPSTGLVTGDGSGIQLNATHLGGSILELTLGQSYLTRRSYLTSIPALTRIRT